MPPQHYFGRVGLLTAERIETPTFLFRGYAAPIAELRDDGFPRQRWTHSCVAVSAGDIARLHLLPAGASRPWFRLVFTALARSGFRRAEWEQEKGNVLVPVGHDITSYA